MKFGKHHPELPDWPNGTPEGVQFRRYATQKWAMWACILTVLALALVTLCHALLSGVLFTLVNERPSRRPRQLLLYFPWTKLLSWCLTSALCFVCVVDTELLDPVYVAKRLGRVAVAILPAVYVLTLRPSPLPRTFYLHVLDLHKFLSRVTVIFSVLHGGYYFYVYYQKQVLFKVLKLANVLGVLALLVFVAMGLTSLLKCRRKFYELFYGVHIFGAISVLPMIRYHSRPRCDGYLYMCLAAILFQVLARVYLSTRTRLRVQYVSATLLLVEIPQSWLTSGRKFLGRQLLWRRWSVASHLRLSGSLVSLQSWVQSSHPYTIASLPEDEVVKLVIRPGDYAVRMRKEYCVFGPHRCLPQYLLNQIHNLMVSRALLVIGGAGIAFGAPVMRYLKMHGAQVRMVWVMRDPYDARVLPQLGLHQETLDGNVEIYYTGDARCLTFGEDDMLDISSTEGACDVDSGHVMSIRSATRHPGVASQRVRRDPVLAQYAMYMANARPHLNMRLKAWLYGYSMGANECCCADRIVDSCAEDRLGAWVLSCGNDKLTDVAQRWAENAGVCYFADTFAL